MEAPASSIELTSGHTMIISAIGILQQNLISPHPNKILKAVINHNCPRSGVLTIDD